MQNRPGSKSLQEPKQVLLALLVGMCKNTTYKYATRNKCLTSSSKCLTSSNKKLLELSFLHQCSSAAPGFTVEEFLLGILPGSTPHAESDRVDMIDTVV